MSIAPLARHSMLLPSQTQAQVQNTGQSVQFSGKKRHDQVDTVSLRKTTPHAGMQANVLTAFEDAYTRNLYEKSRSQLKTGMLEAVSSLKLEKNQPRPTEKEVDILLNSEAYRKHFQQQVLNQLKQSGDYQRILKKTTPEELTAMTEQFSEGRVEPEKASGKSSVKFGMRASSSNDNDEIELSDLTQPTRAAGKLVRRSVNQAVPGMLNEQNSQKLSTFLQNTIENASTPYIAEGRNRANHVLRYMRDELKKPENKELLTQYGADRLSDILQETLSRRENQEAMAQAGSNVVKGALSNLVQSAIPPLCQISAGAVLMAIPPAEEYNSRKDTLSLMTYPGGAYHVTSGTHKLLGISASPKTQMYLGAAGILGALFVATPYRAFLTATLGFASLFKGAYTHFSTNGQRALSRLVQASWGIAGGVAHRGRREFWGYKNPL